MIFSIMIMVPAIPFFLTLGVGYYYFATSTESGTIASMKRIVEDHQQMIDTFLLERKAELEFILYSYSYEDLADSQKLYDVFAHLQKQSSAFVDLGVFNEEGLHVTYQGPYRLIGKDYGNEEWFKHVIKEGYYISDIFLGFRQVPHFVIALTRKDKGRKWVIRATIDTLMFNELVKKVRIGKTGEAYLLNGDGIFQTERRSGGGFLEKDIDRLEHPLSDKGTQISLQKDDSGDRYLYATIWLKNKSWLLVVRQQKDDAFRALRLASYMILVIVLLGGAIIPAMAYYLTDRIVRRFEKLDKDKEQLSRQLVRAVRLAEIGEMAAGFAHEINNPLQIMKTDQALLYANVSEIKARGDLQDSQELVEIYDSIDQLKVQIDRCANITQAILKFGRAGEPRPRDVDLRKFIPEVVGMIEKKASVQGIVVKKELAENLSDLYVDPGQLQQVFLNLLNNAMDAISARHGSKGGEIIVSAAPEEHDKIKITIGDNGIGINPENMKKIFAPFFTTKPVGKGTGLGLSVCFGIIDAMGGTIEVGSEKGVGTAFTIHLMSKTK